MKIARTFTIDYHLYQELRKKPNQSRIVERAVRRYLNSSDEITLEDFKTINILAALRFREDCPKAIRVLCEDHLAHLFE